MFMALAAGRSALLCSESSLHTRTAVAVAEQVPAARHTAPCACRCRRLVLVGTRRVLSRKRRPALTTPSAGNSAHVPRLVPSPEHSPAQQGAAAVQVGGARFALERAGGGAWLLRCEGAAVPAGGAATGPH